MNKKQQNVFNLAAFLIENDMEPLKTSFGQFIFYLLLDYLVVDWAFDCEGNWTYVTAKEQGRGQG